MVNQPPEAVIEDWGVLGLVQKILKVLPRAALDDLHLELALQLVADLSARAFFSFSGFLR
jgi:hypothetical protein